LTPPSISISPQITSLPVGTWKQFTATVMNSTAPVVWTVNPPLGDIFSTGAFHAPIALWTSGTVTVTATAGNVSASAQVTVLAGSASPAAFSPVYVNAGGPAYTDPQGVTWSADMGYVGGATQLVAGNISGTLSPALYQSSHSGSVFNYQFAAPNGTYTVTLKFAEISKTKPGQRVFDVAVNGAPVLSGFDIFTQAGGAFTAVDRTFTATAQNGQIAIQFTGTTGSAIVSAIKIVPAGMP